MRSAEASTRFAQGSCIQDPGSQRAKQAISTQRTVIFNTNAVSASGEVGSSTWGESCLGADVQEHHEEAKHHQNVRPQR
jgi:hypothetical protein